MEGQYCILGLALEIQKKTIYIYIYLLLFIFFWGGDTFLDFFFCSRPGACCAPGREQKKKSEWDT